VSHEPKDYGDGDYSDDRSPSSWAAAGRDDNDLYIWEEVPKEKTPEGPNGGGNNDGGDDNGDATTEATMAEILATTTLSGCIRCVVRLVSLHLGALRNGQRMFSGHGGDEAANGGFGARSRRRLQVPKPQHAQTF
jgi:hypothetical protein